MATRHVCEKFADNDGIDGDDDDDVFSYIYRLSQSKIHKHENQDVSEMHKYLCTEFYSFVLNTTVQKCAAFVPYLPDMPN